MSFAPVRKNGSVCGFYIDGKDYLRDIYNAISGAKKEIFICGYWFYPFLYLLRTENLEYGDDRGDRLDNLLQKKAQKGVKVKIIMWRDLMVGYKSHEV